MAEELRPQDFSGKYLELNGDFKGKDILSTKQFDKASLSKLFKVTQQIEEINEGPLHGALLNIIGNTTIIGILSQNLSFELSRISFSSAIFKLGGKIISLSGESIYPEQTAKDAMTEFQTSSVDLIISTYPKKELYETRTNNIPPLINASEGVGGSLINALAELYEAYIKETRPNTTGSKKSNILHVEMALLTLVLGKEIPCNKSYIPEEA